VEIDPWDEIALGYLACFYYVEAQGRPTLSEKLERLDDGARLYQRIVELDPNCKEAFYALGLIAWVKTYSQLASANAHLGMSFRHPQPLPDQHLRQTLRASAEGPLDDGIKHLSRALEIDPNYTDAMSYMNLLLCEKVILSDTKQEASKHTKAADYWAAREHLIRAAERKRWTMNYHSVSNHCTRFHPRHSR